MRCCMKRGMAMFTSPDDLHCPLLGSHAQAATNTAFVLLQGCLSIRSGAGNSRIGVSVNNCVRGCSSEASQEGRQGCSLAGTELCIAPTVQMYGGARRVHVSPPSSQRVMEREREGRREGGRRRAGRARRLVLSGRRRTKFH